MKFEDSNTDVELPRPPVSENSKEALENYGEMILEDYRSFKTNFIEWLLTVGKEPYKREGYSESTAVHTHYKIDEAYRWKWENNEEYSTEFTPDEATELLDEMMRLTPHPERYVYSFEKCLRRLFKHFRDDLNRSIEPWDHDIPIKPNQGSPEKVKDKFYPDEMNRLYEAALEKFSVRSYYNKNMSPAERDSLKATIAQRLTIPKNEVGPEEFQQASSWKIPSIIATSSDCGLRPIEVGRAKVDWFDLDRELMLIPHEESTKSNENWECHLSKKTANALSHWVEERGSYKKYQGREAMWLTKYGNPYASRSLNRVLNDLMDQAEITQKNRKLSWYSFRHGAAQMWIEEEGLYEAKHQLRHKSIETTLGYTRGRSSSTHNSSKKW